MTWFSHNVDLGFHTKFGPMQAWLQDRTHAFRLHPATLSFGNHEVGAVVAEVPEDLGVLFRLFWYEG